MKMQNFNDLLGKIERFQPAACWATVMFLLMTLGVMLVESHPKIEYAPLEPLWALILFWSISQFVTVIPLVSLIAVPGLRKFHVAIRMKIIFGYLIPAWMTFSAFWFRYEDMHGNLFGREAAIVLIGLTGLTLLAARWYLRKRFFMKPETLFP